MPKKLIEKAGEVVKVQGQTLQRGSKALNQKFEESSRYTQREIEGAIRALNIFFGAVIGISLAGIGDIPTLDYVAILVSTSAIVMAILLVSHTHRRVWNALTMIIVLAGSWWIVEGSGTDLAFVSHVPDKLLPTLSVWAGMALLTEFSSRMKEPG